MAALDPDDPPGRPLLLRLALRLLVAGLVGAGAVAVLVDGEEPGSPSSRSEVSAYLLENPGVPLVLPRATPPGYVWKGPSDWNRGADGTVDMRTSVFYPEPVTDGPIVELCVARRSNGCSSSPRIERRLDTGERVVISFFGGTPTPEVAQWWRTIPLVPDLEVEWLN